MPLRYVCHVSNLRTLCLVKPTKASELSKSPDPAEVQNTWVLSPSDFQKCLPTCSCIIHAWAKKQKKKKPHVTNLRKAKLSRLAFVASKSGIGGDSAADLAIRFANSHRPPAPQSRSHCGNGHSGTCHVTSLTLSQLWPCVAKHLDVNAS
jgi:hypothetical protein